MSIVGRLFRKQRNGIILQRYIMLISGIVLQRHININGIVLQRYIMLILGIVLQKYIISIVKIVLHKHINGIVLQRCGKLCKMLAIAWLQAANLGPIVILIKICGKWQN